MSPFTSINLCINIALERVIKVYVFHSQNEFDSSEVQTVPLYHNPLEWGYEGTGVRNDSVVVISR